MTLALGRRHTLTLALPPRLTRNLHPSQTCACALTCALSGDHGRGVTLALDARTEAAVTIAKGLDPGELSPRLQNPMAVGPRSGAGLLSMARETSP